MQGDEVHGGADPPALQLGNEIIPSYGKLLLLDAHDEERPRVRLGPLGDTEKVHAAECGEVAPHDGAAPLEELARAQELDPPDSRGNVREIVLVAGRDDVVTPRRRRVRVPIPHVPVDAVEAHDADPARHLVPVGDDHPAFARRDRLRGIERVDPDVAVRPDDPAAQRHRAAVRRVLDDGDAVAQGDMADGLHVARMAGDVHRDDRCHALLLRRLLQGLLERRGVHVEARLVDVDEHRVGPKVAHDFRARRKGVRRRDHDAARAHPDGLEAEVQAGGGRVEGQGVALADSAGELLLEARAHGAGGEPARAHHLENGVLLDPSKGRSGEGHRGKLLRICHARIPFP